MAGRAAIIISNGGVASALTKGLIPATRGIKPTKKEEAATVQVIMKNLKVLNAKTRGGGKGSPVARSLNPSSPGNGPKIYWRLKGDKPNGRENGKPAS